MGADVTGLVLAAAGGGTDFPLLTALVLAPFLTAVGVLATPRSRPDVARLLGFTGSVLTAALAATLLIEFDTDEAGFQMETMRSWISAFGISWHLGVDGISLFLVALTAFLFPLALLGAGERVDSKAFVGWMMLLEAAVIGVFLALDLFVFFVFFEIVLVPMYFLIGLWGHGRRVYAATKFFLYTMLGSAFMLVGMLSLVYLHARSTGTVTFDLVEIAEAQTLATTTARWLFLAFGISFAVKVPLFPLHTWLPDAHTEAPTAGSVILAGVLLKLGTYGFVRFGLYLFPEASATFAPALATLAVIGITYGAVVAAMQADLKRLVAYSSVAHLGFIVLGTFALTTTGLEGGILQMVNHGLSTGALFFLVGMIYQRRHTRAIAELGGLQRSAPILAGVFMVVMLSSIGLPGLNGFIGEFLVLLGAFETLRWWTVVAAAGVILAAVYLLWAYQRVFHGEPTGDNAEMADLRWAEGAVLLPMVALIVFLGVYPKPVLERMEPAVDRLVEHVDAFRDGGPAATSGSPADAATGGPGGTGDTGEVGP